MLESLIWILLAGFFGGQIARRLKVPPLVGMVGVGVLIGPQVGDVVSMGVLGAADGLRTIAVMVILMKAGLGLDRDKLAQQGTVALRLGFLPGACEAVAIAFLSTWLLSFDLFTGLLLGCVIGAESPAVIVPGMLRLKSLGWGVKKGIPDAILTGSALSDVLLLLVFSLLLAFLAQGAAVGALGGVSLPGGLVLSPLQLLPFQVVFQIGLGVLLGWVTARSLVLLLTQQNWTQNAVQDALVAAGLALLLVVAAQNVPVFSGYLAVMSMGFFLIELDAPLARRLRGGFNSLWVVAEIVLFVLLGTSIQLDVLEETFWVGLLILLGGTLLGRSLGWYLSTLGSNWTVKEKLFLLPGNSAKATVQAAIGAVPLAQGIEGGQAILAISALSILITAPLGAWAIPMFAPKLLARGVVDPTKVAIARRITLVAAVDTSPACIPVLTQAADLARRSDGEIVVIHVVQSGTSEQIESEQIESEQIKRLHHQVARTLVDIRHRFITAEGEISEEIVRIAKEQGATEIIIGGQRQNLEEAPPTSSIARSVLNLSSFPVVIAQSP
ncbi:MAG: cation:proton antiporter [Phormidesmis sp.]